MRQYKVIHSFDNSITYYGFNKRFDTPHDVVLITVDGEIDLWAVDDVKGFENLINFLSKEENKTGITKILGRYKSEGFRGVICPKELV